MKVFGASLMVVGLVFLLGPFILLWASDQDFYPGAPRQWFTWVMFGCFIFGVLAFIVGLGLTVDDPTQH